MKLILILNKSDLESHILELIENEIKNPWDLTVSDFKYYVNDKWFMADEVQFYEPSSKNKIGGYITLNEKSS